MAHEHKHDCSHLKEALADYLDGEFDSDLCRELQEHLEGCERCQVVVDTTRKTIRFYSQEQPVAIPPEVHERLQAALKARMRAREEG